MKRAKIQYVPVRSGGNDRWFFRVMVANGEVLAHSKTYETKGECLRAIRSFRFAVMLGKTEEYG